MSQDLVTVETAIRSGLSSNSGLMVRVGFDPDTDSRNICWYWILGEEDGPADLDDKKPGDRVYICQFDDVAGFKAWLLTIQDALARLEAQMDEVGP